MPINSNHHPEHHNGVPHFFCTAECLSRLGEPISTRDGAYCLFMDSWPLRGPFLVVDSMVNRQPCARFFSCRMYTVGGTIKIPTEIRNPLLSSNP